MSYPKKMFNACVFNPLTENPMLQEYPRLSEIVAPEWADDPYLDNLLRFVVMVYDPKSPLVINERDLNYRKGIAAELAMFNMEEEEVLQSIYNQNHPFIADLITKYLMRFAKSKEFAAICAIDFKYWESIKRLMIPISEGKDKDVLSAVQIKAAISEELDKDIQRLDSYTNKFFGEDTELVKKKGKLTPELMSNIK
ncbi:MAG TPA: hypothetical protein VGZ90_13300 [Puia sp.]|jgi:hypothetical protein|nr:hypothetical protein [Puia sp.]